MIDFAKNKEHKMSRRAGRQSTRTNPGLSVVEIFQAIGNLNIPDIEKYINQGGPVDLTDINGDTLLIVAIRYQYYNRTKSERQLRIINLLLDGGADPNQLNSHQLHPLHIAAEVNRADIIDTLLRHGANPNVKTHTGNPVYAAFFYPQVTDIFLRAGADVNPPSMNPRTVQPLNYVINDEAGYDTAVLLLNAGADPNTFIIDGEGSALYPIEIIVNEYVGEYIDLDDPNEDESGDARKSLIALIRAGARIEDINLSSHRLPNFTNHVKKLFELYSPGDPNLATPGGIANLMIAAQHGPASLVYGLLRKGANVNQSDVNGNTALHYAIESGDFYRIRALLEFGADPFLVNRSGYSALDYLNNPNYWLTKLLEDSLRVNPLVPRLGRDISGLIRLYLQGSRE